MSQSPNNSDAELEGLISRINSMSSGAAVDSVPIPPQAQSPPANSAQPGNAPAASPVPNQAGAATRRASQLGAPQTRPQAAPQPAPSQRIAEPVATPQRVQPQAHATAPPAPQSAAPADHLQVSTIPGFLAEGDNQRDKDQPFVPKEPTSLEEARLTESDVEQLILKFLFARGEATGRDIAEQVCLPFGIVENVLFQLKAAQLVAYRDATQMNDYVYISTELGRERGRRYMQDCAYFGSATVSLGDYINSVKEQSLAFQQPSRADLQEAFSDLLINQQMFARLGPAINSGRGMFLFGFPGNGKTSIAERVTQTFGKYIYIPRVIGIQGEVIRLFDPNYHEEVPVEDTESLLQESRIDKRWVRIKRPTVIVGGELTMSQLELQSNENNGTTEAPVQLKSNCGTLVIDDFGRQKMSTDELLNRWIVPLEKRYDFLNMTSGKCVQVPFDQLVVFSTNLEPRDLVDDAFLRRIPYKIEVKDPTEAEFIALFKIMCPIMGFTYDEEAIRYLIDTHYLPVDRPFRCCQPRDLLLQIKNHCAYQREVASITKERFDIACENYFAIM